MSHGDKKSESWEFFFHCENFKWFFKTIFRRFKFNLIILHSSDCSWKLVSHVLRRLCIKPCAFVLVIVLLFYFIFHSQPLLLACLLLFQLYCSPFFCFTTSIGFILRLILFFFLSVLKSFNSSIVKGRGSTKNYVTLLIFQ